MMEKVLSRSIRAICLGGLAFGVTAASAQETTQPLQRVEVTGSRIRQVDLETAQPVQTMTAAQIQATGLVTVGDILNNLSSAGSPDFSKGGALTSNREAGGQYVNLRNLGSNRLLVLVDGKRWTQTVAGYTDMSTIPSSMIERMDILKDGASSIYGSDAIAGVVNIILKKSMEGGQLSVYTGQNEKADGKNRDFSLSYGANSDKASLMFGLSHTEQGAVWARDRNITNSSYGPAHPTDGYGAGPWGRITAVNPANGGSLTAAASGGFNKYLNHTGDASGNGVGQSSRDPNSYHNYANADDDKFNSSSQMHFTTPTKLDTLFAKGLVNLPLDMTFKTTAMFSQRKSLSTVAGYPLNSTTQTKYPVYIDKDSYYNPYGNQVAGAGNGQDLYFARRVTELTRNTENENRTLHVDAALDGEFEVKGLAWNWGVGANYNKVTGSTLSNGNINLLNLKKSLGPSFMNASGVVQCGTPGAPIALAECKPWDILGGPSASTPETLAYVNSVGQATYGSTITSFTADIGGEVYRLPAGAIGFAGGLEHREVRGYDRPGQFEQSGYSTNLAGNPTYGKYTVKEAYAELNVPVLKGQKFAELLSFNLASRYSDYSNSGDTTNSKVSVMWKPINDLLVRGTWAEGFRAPSLGDTFGGGSQSYDTYLDPCDTRFGEASRNAAVAARCITKGAPENFRQVNQSGTQITGSGGAQTTSPFNTSAGNAALTPETATTRTAGFVYSPSYVPGLSVGLDWYSIKVNDRITGVSANYVLGQCYTQSVESFCSSIKRDATGQITTLSRGNANLGQLKTEGLDLSINYRFPRTAYGQFSISSNTSYVDEFSVKSSATSEWFNYAGEYYYNRVKSNNQLNWNLGNWGATWGMRYYSPVYDSCWDTEDLSSCNSPTKEYSGGTGANKLGSLFYHDLNVSYKTSFKSTISVGINNLFDKKPRITFDGAASSSAVDADLPIDRFFYVRYNQSF